MATGSSTSKAAKLAQRGKGRKVRFQGGTIFPIAVAVTLVLGLGLIVYARATVPAADSSPPTANDHWHMGYGFNLCGQWYSLAGDLEELDSRGNVVNTQFLLNNVHSHDDAIIHWHPYSGRAVGKNAKLKIFLDAYGVSLTDDELTFPADNALGGQTLYKEGETQCDGQDAELSVKTWEVFTDTDGGKRYISNMDQIHMANNGMVVAIYFLPKDADQSMPPSAGQTPADDGAPIPQLTTTTVAETSGDTSDTGASVGETDAPTTTGVTTTTGP